MDLIQCWIDATNSSLIHQDLTDDQNEAIVQLYTLCDLSPIIAEKVILDIVQKKPGDKVLNSLGAGPLESLIAQFPEYLDRFISAARQNPKIRLSLAHVDLSDDRIADKLKLDRFLAEGE